ncbi:MAG: hypothetical protein EAZ30_06730 [Betaproteobacteria bacterium]|nr:MAG: hypothetical protein EAZ43_02515 [Betaproteobacteria bacterium]TAG48261.1 MAG: hypothetical protein EAZ30_06730 [Betaproteobacteria bacterium]
MDKLKQLRPFLHRDHAEIAAILKITNKIKAEESFAQPQCSDSNNKRTGQRSFGESSNINSWFRR